MQEQIERDLKAALLAGDRQKSETLKTLKSAIQYESLSGSNKAELTDEQIQKVVAREAKKRQEAADIYTKNGASEQAQREMAEKAILEVYLPKQVSEEEIAKIVDEEIGKLTEPGINSMGPIISAVKDRLGTGADGATIAKLVRQKLEPK